MTQTVPLDPPEDEDLDRDEAEADEELSRLPPPPEDDFADLDADLALAMAQQSQRVQLEAARGRLKRLAASKKPDHIHEREALTATIRTLEEGIVWSRQANVILLQQQTCLTCGHTSQFSLGWWMEQQHRTDPNCRRLLKGKAIERLPEKVEIHAVEPVDVCADCAEATVIINAATQEHSCTVYHENPMTSSSPATVACTTTTSAKSPGGGDSSPPSSVPSSALPSLEPPSASSSSSSPASGDAHGQAA